MPSYPSIPPSTYQQYDPPTNTDIRVNGNMNYMNHSQPSLSARYNGQNDLGTRQRNDSRLGIWDENAPPPGIWIG
jgi:hypothetical protein